MEKKSENSKISLGIIGNILEELNEYLRGYLEALSTTSSEKIK